MVSEALGSRRRRSARHRCAGVEHSADDHCPGRRSVVATRVLVGARSDTVGCRIESCDHVAMQRLVAAASCRCAPSDGKAIELIEQMGDSLEIVSMLRSLRHRMPPIDADRTPCQRVPLVAVRTRSATSRVPYAKERWRRRRRVTTRSRLTGFGSGAIRALHHMTPIRSS